MIQELEVHMLVIADKLMILFRPVKHMNSLIDFEKIQGKSSIIIVVSC